MNTDGPTGIGREPVCAYCERAVRVRGEGHIEHFRGRNLEPKLTFEWENLYLSCSTNDPNKSLQHCGHHKGSSAQTLIRPDADDPDDYLEFSSGGIVKPRGGLSVDDEQLANDTIQVLNLNAPRLRGSRIAAVESFRLGHGIDLDELKSWPIAEAEEYLREEIEACRGLEYSTVIRHFLTFAG